MGETVIYTGAIDAFYDYALGKLEYRTVRFETEVLDTDNYQGVAVVNYTDRETPYTRVIEHKHFEIRNPEKDRHFQRVFHRLERGDGAVLPGE